MAAKLSFVFGLGAGYLLGTRAGRQRYDQIVAQVQQFWRDPRVQRQAGQARRIVEEKAGQGARVTQEEAASGTSESDDPSGTSGGTLP